MPPDPTDTEVPSGSPVFSSKTCKLYLMILQSLIIIPVEFPGEEVLWKGMALGGAVCIPPQHMEMH